MNGGDWVGEVMLRHGVQYVFTLCGGHISPILVGAKQRGIRVVDVRDEANAVFAADAVARLTGVPGVAAVTAGPGVTNTITALQNAKMAQSPLVLIGGATPTVLKGRGALQDIDQMALMRPLVKWSKAVKTIRALPSAIDEALYRAASGVPGPTFVEIPVDLLYDEELVRSWYQKELDGGRSIGSKAVALYMRQHLTRQFAGSSSLHAPDVRPTPPPEPRARDVAKAAELLARAKKPVLVLGSQAVVQAGEVDAIADAVRTLGIPTWCGGMSRGLLGRTSDIQFLHKRSAALREADCVFVIGFPFDFRMGYGRKINFKADLIAVNRDATDVKKNRRPTLPVVADGGRFLQALARRAGPGAGKWSAWFDTLRATEAAREQEIADQSAAPTSEYLNPVRLCQRIEAAIGDDATMVVDGGDFVGTAAYTLRPRKPLGWLDPGVFGTLGVGGGFALGAALVRPTDETWLIWGDGSSAYTLAEFDTFRRFGLPVIAVIGTDASWAQIAREQTEILEDDVGTVLRRTDYHRVAEGYGGKGLLLDDPQKTDQVLAEAKELAAAGHAVVINAMIGKSDFRKGSISM